MIKYLVVAVTLMAALALGACGASQAHHAKQVAQSPQAKADERKAQKIVTNCLQKSHSRKSFINCISPPGKKAQTERCAQQKLAKDGLLTRKARKRFYNDAAGCILR